MTKAMRFMVAACLLSISGLSVAQPATSKTKLQGKADSSTSPAKSTPQKAADEPKFEPVYFQPGAPFSDYRKNDPAKIYEWLSRYISDTPGKPDQFSTSDDRREYDSALSARLQAIGQIPFIRKCQQKYDGDQQRFELKIGIFPIAKYFTLKEVDARAVNLKTITLSTVNIKRDAYTGQNAYGAETQISRTTEDSYVIAFPHDQSPTSAMVSGMVQRKNSPMPYELGFYYIQFHVPMPSAIARANEQDITCLFIFSVTPPYLLKFTERTAPTRDMPFDKATNFYAIYGTLDQVAVINKSSGEIYEQAAR